MIASTSPMAMGANGPAPGSRTTCPTVSTRKKVPIASATSFFNMGRPLVSEEFPVAGLSPLVQYHAPGVQGMEAFKHRKEGDGAGGRAGPLDTRSRSGR